MLHSDSFSNVSKTLKLFIVNTIIPESDELIKRVTDTDLLCGRHGGRQDPPVRLESCCEFLHKVGEVSLVRPAASAVAGA